MTLLERIAARETCAVVACDRHRTDSSLFCHEHLNDMWANRLDRQADGTFVVTGPNWRFTAKELAA